MIRWCKLGRENMPVKYIFNVNQFTAYVCLFPRSTLPCADSPYPMLVLTGPQGCGKRELTHRLCQDLSEFFAYGSVTNICILKLTYVTGTPQLEIINRICTCLHPQNLSHHKGALLWWGEWCWLPFPQRGRVSEYDSHGALVFLLALLTSGVNEKRPVPRLNR